MNSSILNIGNLKGDFIMDIYDKVKNYIATRKDSALFSDDRTKESENARIFSYKGNKIFYISPVSNQYKKRFICIYEKDAKILNMRPYVKNSGIEWDYQYKIYNHKIGAKLHEKYERNLENLIEDLLTIYK